MRITRETIRTLTCLLFLLPSGIILGQSIDREVEAILLRAKKFRGAAALPDLEIARQICRKNTCVDSLNGKLYHQLSVAYFQGYIDDDLAIAFADTAIQYFERQYDDRHPKLANEYYNRGVMRTTVGLGTPGLIDMTEALSRLSSNTHLSTATTDSISTYWHQEIAKNYRLQRDFQLADDYARTGLSIANRRWSGPHMIQGDLLRSLGNVRYNRQDYAGAVNYFEQARKIYELLLPRPESDLLLIDKNLGLAYAGLQRHDASIRHLREVEAHFAAAYRKAPDKGQFENWAGIHIDLLTAEAGRGDYSAADRHFQEAESLLDRLFEDRTPGIYAELYTQHARALLQQGNSAEARLYTEQALAILLPQEDAPRAVSSPLGPFEFVFQALHLRAEIFEHDDRPEAALEVYEKLHSIIAEHRRHSLNGWSKYFLIADVVPVYEAAIRVSLKIFRTTGEKKYLEQAYGFNARNKAVVLREQLQHECALDYAQLPEETQLRERALIEQIQTLDRQINGRPTPRILDSLQVLRVAILREHTAHLRLLESKYPRYYQLKYAPPTQVSSKEVGQTLAPDQFAIEYFSGRDSLYAFLITRDELQVTAVAQPENLRDDVTQYHELVSSGITEACEDRFLELAHQLYRQLLAPPLAKIERGVYRRMLIIPDGLLHFVAFETLATSPRKQIEGSRDFVLERYACSYHYASYFLVNPFQPSASTKKEKRFGGFGAEYDEATLNYLQDAFVKKPSADGGAQPLPCGSVKNRRYLGKLYHSDDEVRNIAQRLAGDYWLNEEVTKSTFLREMNNYDILHLALHGSYDLDYPMNSALAFTKTTEDDALLRAGDIYTLDLDCDMMVLSACNTSFGKLMPGEGVMTLARAFNYAGAETVVASLWSLPDRSTSVIMDDFYRQLQTGIPKDLALQNAKLNYLNSDNLSTPSTRLPTYWGATVVIGATDPIISDDKFGKRSWMYAGVALLSLFLIGLAYRSRH